VLGTVIAVHALPTLGSQVNNDNSQFLPNSAPSNQAAVLAQPLIGSSSQSQIPVVAVTSAPALTAADQTALHQLATDLKKVPTVTSVRFLAESAQRDASELLATSTTQPFGPTGPKILVDDLQAAIARAGLPADLHVHLAGEIVTNVATNEKSNKQGNLIQVFSILFIIVLLLIIFRSLLAPFPRPQDLLLHPDPPHRPHPRSGDRLRALPGVPGARGAARRAPPQGGRGHGRQPRR
jgi:RND superfamily putative drug exporter